MSRLAAFLKFDASLNQKLASAFTAYRRRYVQTNSAAPVAHLCLMIGGFGFVTQIKTRAARQREHDLAEDRNKRLAEAEGREYVPSGHH